MTDTTARYEPTDAEIDALRDEAFEAVRGIQDLLGRANAPIGANAVAFRSWAQGLTPSAATRLRGRLLKLGRSANAALNVRNRLHFAHRPYALREVYPAAHTQLRGTVGRLTIAWAALDNALGR
jgi:hypothetical protein